MADLTSAPAAEVARGEQPRVDSRLRLFVTPVVLLAITGLYLEVVFSSHLDSIEARQITASNLITLTWQHVVLTAVSALLVVVVAIPLGILVTRRSVRFLAAPVTLLANLGQAIPVIGLLVLLAVLFVKANFFGFWLTVTVCVVYGVLPVLRNTITGVRSIDPALIESARGIGMTPWRVLTRVELPLAVPYILAGLRTTLVLIVGVATLGTFVDAGGLGDLINTGIKLERTVILFTGGILAVMLALLIDWVGGLIERALTPKGL
ncbi:ABC transporter permease [Fodinicola feengrottensis]|uniref:ABC transporter permease n=1 Tax=Fodinicola feengrottensis TaxID=435914 RepID=A0ABP4SBE4_9ACTN|nr:ABC transporter permease [Fodinicola feengrottensis]